jgi:ribosomal protein S18 acetylase RimI-like enzyme
VLARYEGTGPNLFFVRQGPGDVLRVASWRGDPKIALLTPLPGRPPPGRVELERVLDSVADGGYEVVLTGALDVTAQRPYLAAGFEEHARLHVLGRALDEVPTAEHAQLHRARRRDRGQVHEVDASAFSPFWQLGEAGLDDALGATPDARFRVARDDRVVAYAICGLAGRQGYVQRLAVRPGNRRAGLGAALVVDGLEWMRKRGADDAVVNTQVDNVAALALYDHLGFRRRGPGLRVLRRALRSNVQVSVPGGELEPRRPMREERGVGDSRRGASEGLRGEL